MDPKPTPRILVVADFGPGSAGGGWIILKNLLRGQDWNHVYWWSLCEEPGRYQMGGRHQSFNLNTKLLPKRRFTRFKSWILDKIVLPGAAKQLRAFVKTVQPDFILLVPHAWTIPVAHRALAGFKGHLHVSLHDRPDIAGNNRPAMLAIKNHWMYLVADLYRRAATRDVIGPGMASEMRRRTGIDCENFFRCAVEPETLANLPLPEPTRTDDVIRVGYAGTIIAEDSFARFTAAARAAGERLGRRVEIHLYSWHRYRDRAWFDADIVIEHGPKSEEEVLREFRKMTWGLALMHLDDADPLYNRFSFPCKFTTALATGVPLICIGHHESALITLASQYDLGLLVTDKDTDALADELATTLADYPRFAHFQNEGSRCARAEFNAEQNRRVFQSFLDQANAGD